jgi:hypothetical protein
VRWNGSGQTVTSNGNVFIYSGMSNISDPNMKGVGILLSKNIRAALLEWNPISERIITARVETKFRKMSTVQCYAPTEDAEPSEKEVFYSLLDRTLTDTYRSDIVLMMGDLTPKLDVLMRILNISWGNMVSHNEIKMENFLLKYVGDTG